MYPPNNKPKTNPDNTGANQSNLNSLRSFEDNVSHNPLSDGSTLDNMERREPESVGSQDSFKPSSIRKDTEPQSSPQKHGGKNSTGSASKASHMKSPDGDGAGGKLSKVNELSKIKDGGKDQSIAKTGKEATKIARDIAAQNYAAATLKALKNRKALAKLALKIAVGIAALGVIGFIIIASIISSIGGGIQGVSKGIQRAATAPHRFVWNNTVARIADAQVTIFNKLSPIDIDEEKVHDATHWSSIRSGETDDIVSQLKSLDLGSSLQNYARLGDKSNNPTLMDRFKSFASIEDSLKEIGLRKVGKNLQSDIKVEEDGIVINGTKWKMSSMTAGTMKYKDKKLFLQKFAETLGTAMQSDDVSPQLNSFKERIAKLYGLKYEAWPNKGAEYDIRNNEKMTKAEAFKITQKYTNQNITEQLPTRHSRVVFVDNLQEEIKPKLQAALEEGKEKPNDVAEDELNKFLIKNLFESDDVSDEALGGYSICLARDLIDGALPSGDDEDSEELSAVEQSTQSMTYGSMRQAMLFSSAADQIDSGELNGNEIGANLNMYGDMYNQGNYQNTIFNSNWDGEQFTQISNNSYTQLLTGAPPDGMIGDIVAFVLGQLEKKHEIKTPTVSTPFGDIGGFTFSDIKPIEQFSNDENRCFSTDDIKDFINPSFDYGGVLQNFLQGILEKLGGNSGEKMLAEAIKGINDIFIKYILYNEGASRQLPQTQSILDTIPGSKFSSAIKLGFSFLLKASVYNNLALNFPGYSNINYTNQVAGGYMLLGNEMNRRMTFGRPLTLAEAKEQKKVAYREYKRYLDSQSLVEKIANVNSPYSLITKTAIITNSWQQNPARMASSSLSGILSYMSQPSKLVQSAGKVALAPDFITKSDVAFAAEDAAYGNSYRSPQYPDAHNSNIQWGWTEAEMNKMMNDPSYSLIENNSIVSGWIKKNGDNAKRMRAMEACFDTLPDKKRGSIPSSIDKLVMNPFIMTMVCNKMTDEVGLRYRIYRNDLQTISDLKDLQTVTQDTAPSGGSASETAGTEVDMDKVFEDSTDVACAPNTIDVGIQDGYRSGNLIKIRVCALPNLPSSGKESQTIAGADGKAIVNSRISGAAYALAQAARADGIDIKASSSFRTMEHQQCLYGGGCGAAGPVAKPGTSNHQMGLAIDFQLPTGNSGATKAPGQDVVYDWLMSNSEKFGFKKLSSEAWHFSVTGG